MHVFDLVISTESSEDGGGMQSEIFEETAPVAAGRKCPFAIYSEEEAILRIENTSMPGNVVKVKNMSWCRLGNHFTTLFRNLALGYCCKSKVVSLQRINIRVSHPSSYSSQCLHQLDKVGSSSPYFISFLSSRQPAPEREGISVDDPTRGHAVVCLSLIPPRRAACK